MTFSTPSSSCRDTDCSGVTNREAVLVSDDLRVSRLHDTSDGEPGVEALWLSVGGAGRAQVVVGAIYRPPGTLTDRLRGAIREQFEVALAVGKPVYVLGDFNVNLLNVSSSDTVHFNSLLSDFDMSHLTCHVSSTSHLTCLFVNDLSCFLPHGRLVSYADDTQILDSAPSNPCDLQVLKSGPRRTSSAFSIGLV